MIYDLAIIGGGPAGAAAGVYAARKRLRSVLITKDWLGQSVVSNKIENWIGSQAISGADLSRSLENHVKAYAKDIVDIREGEICLNIERVAEQSFFRITTNRSSYEAKTILITAGSKRRRLEVAGADKFEHKGLTYCATCDGPIFADQDVAVIGGGNSALESAAQLLAYCKSVTLLIRSDRFRADPGTVEKVLSHPKIRVVKFAMPKEVKGDKMVSSLVYTDTANSRDVEIPVAGIFVEIGAIPNSDFAKNVITLNPSGNIPVDAINQKTTTAGIWAAGDITDGLYHQNNIAAGDAVKAIEDIYNFLNAK